MMLSFKKVSFEILFRDPFFLYALLVYVQNIVIKRKEESFFVLEWFRSMVVLFFLRFDFDVFGNVC